MRNSLGVRRVSAIGAAMWWARLTWRPSAPLCGGQGLPGGHRRRHVAGEVVEDARHHQVVHEVEANDQE
eukprot:6119365-Pyramimonas_sp.AAC.1